VLSKDELHSRFEIYTEQYAKHINIEAQTAMQMTKRLYIPTAIRFMTELGNSVQVAGKHATVQKELLSRVATILNSIAEQLAALEKETSKAQAITKVDRQAAAFRDKVLPLIGTLRKNIDNLETITPGDLWPVPTYSDLLFKL
jgi:glutamine synthetase